MAEPPQKRPVKFVASDQDGMPVKRRQVQQACEPCRKRKKRCSHVSDAAAPRFLQPDPQQQQQQQQPQPESSGGPHRPGASPGSPAHNPGASSAREVASQLIELSASRFVGDLSPESIFIRAASSSARDASRRNPSDIGTWLPARRPDHGADARRGPAATARAHEPEGSSRADDGPLSLRTLSWKAVSSPGSPRHRVDGPQPHGVAGNPKTQDGPTVCPPDDDYDHLCTIYLERVQPIWPIVKVADVHATRRPKCIKDIILRQAISLATCVEPSASSHLRLEPGGPVLSFADFQRQLSKSVLSALDGQVLADRIDHIRVLFLLFFYQPARASELELPSLVFSQAMHYAVSIGIHLVGSGAQDARSKEAESLYCALWALDRMNAAFHGRPCLLHERDTDRDLDECIAAQEEPGFRLFLNVIKMLDKVIALYRPRSRGDEIVVLPVFESMIMDAEADKAPPYIHSSIEIFYHAVSVLSCRQPPSAFASSAPDQAHLPHPNINARRSLSADRIVDAVSFALNNPASPDRITVVPFVPYALALSLSVSYRKMRYSKIPLYRLRGKTRFMEVVGLLKQLGDTFTCARVNAGLGEAILQEMDKAAQGLVNSGAAVAAVAATTASAAADSSITTTTTTPNGPSPSPSDTRPSSRRALPAEVTLASRRNIYVREADRQPRGSIAGTPRAIQAGQSPLMQHPTPSSQQQAPGRPSPPPVPAGPGQGAVVALQPGAPQPPPQPPATALGDMLDVDIFGHFDPGFDLSTADAALSANLDMGFPQVWSTPWPNWPS